MYPSGNNYNQNYSYQQGFNMPTQSFESAPCYPSGPGAPPIGFNVGNDMNQTPGYNPGYGPSSQPSAYGNYNQYPSNPALYMPPIQSPQQQYTQHGSYMPAQQGPQYQQGQCTPMNSQAYGTTYPPHMSNPHMPQYNQSTPLQQSPGHGVSYPQINQQQTPSYNPYSSPSAPTQNYTTQTNMQTSLDCIGAAGETYRGTMKPHPNFSAEQDCNVLRKAMKGFGTDEKAIIECLGRRNLAQRLEIKKMFKTMFGKDLIDELKSELSGNFSRAVIESLYDSDYYDAYSLQKAMEGAGTREDVLTEILTSRSNQQIENIKDIYKRMFNKNLEKEVISETSGFYKRVLVSCLQANRKELTGDETTRLRQQGPCAVINTNMARQEAQELYNAGENKIGTDEACFIKIFATRNKYQLRATFDEYKQLAGRDILTSIEREMSGDLASSLKAIAMQAVNPAQYFATRLYTAMKGAGTNDTALIRILLTRSEIDLDNIKIEFHRQYSKPLDGYVRGDTSGDYQRFLLRFIDGN